MGVSRGTTPTFRLTFPEESGVNLTQAANVYVTFKSNGRYLTKTGSALELTERTIDVFLSQEDTLQFSVGNVKIQVNWTTPDGLRLASHVIDTQFDENLIDRVIE